ncbi:MAG TPA: ROK family protein [Planctomycetota bacterium]|nr:ROK family protein [Planctomycetota bacterium]
MASSLLRVPPKFVPPLDPEHRPAWLGNRNFEAAAKKTRKAVTMVFAVEAAAGAVTRFETVALPPGHPQAAENLAYAERIVKFLLWSRGGWKVSIAGPKEVADHLRSAYGPGGARAFDAEFMAKVYEKPAFVVEHVAASKLPKEKDTATPVGGHLDGCRIGFDAGGSDRKVAAVIDGKEVFATETVWQPKTNSDPQYHFDGIDDSIRQAAAHLPRIDAIGVSSAGIIINNRCMAALLFKKVAPEDFDKRIKSIYTDVAKKWGDVPIEVANDGDVTALAGALSLKAKQVLGIAMGTSQAGGYVDRRGYITGWLNELAFAPVDYAENAPRDVEWSQDLGVGGLYFSQDAVIRLAPKVGFPFEPNATPGEKLKAVQTAFQNGDRRMAAIFESIGVYMGYAVLHYARFYAIKHVLLLGRVTSGEGGDILLKTARKVMKGEDPKAARAITLHVPDEATRRVGQAIAAASLPELRRKKKARR